MTIDFLIFYHFPCPDGIYSALILQRYLELKCPKSKIITVQQKVYEELDIKKLFDGLILNNTVCYVLDIVKSKKFIEDLNELFQKIVIVDHHSSATSILNEIKTNQKFEIIFDLNKCCSRLMLENFKIEKLEHVRISKIIDLVEDHDLFKNKLKETDVTILGIKYIYNENKGDPISYLKDLTLANLIEIGENEKNRQDKILLENEKNSFVIDVNNSNIHCRCCFTEDPRYSLPKIGDILAKKSFKENLHPLAIVYYEEPELEKTKEYKVSIYSFDNKFDVLKIAKKFPNSGGHPNSAGFTIRKEEFDQWTRK